MQRLLVAAFFALVTVAQGRPQAVEGWYPVKTITDAISGVAYQVDANNLDYEGCLVAENGLRVCPEGVAREAILAPVAAAPAPVAQPLAAVVPAPVGWVPASEIVSPITGEVIQVNADSLDINGCLVGPSGARVCPQGAVGSAGDQVTFRGNRGHAGTGSNGNAGPIDENGFAVDPAAQTYLKQIKAYEEWALRQAENNKHIIG